MYSLQSRLALWLGLLLVGIFGAHIVVMNQFPRYLAEERVLTRLHHDMETLLKQLQVLPNQPPALNPEALAPIYTSALSGHYFQIQQGSLVLRSPSLVDESLKLPTLGENKSAVLHLKGPGQIPLLMWVRKVQKNGQTLVISVAEDIRDIEEDITEQRKASYLITAITMLLLLVLQWFLIHRAIQPVEKARQELLAIEKGELDKIRQKVPSEIQPLVDELNHLLTVMQKRLERSRHATGNLAHTLKTPLSVLNQLLSTPEIRHNPELSAEINHISQSIQTSIDRELKRARLSGGVAPGQRFSPAEELPILVTVMEKVYVEKNLTITTSLLTQKSYPADREDMLEVFGNLLDNACKWASQQVILTLKNTPNAQGLQITVEDDGAGIKEDTKNLLTARGIRLDETTPGHGLGLSIVKEIIEQYGGTLHFSTSARLGGLQVDILFPWEAV